MNITEAPGTRKQLSGEKEGWVYEISERSGWIEFLFFILFVF